MTAEKAVYLLSRTDLEEEMVCRSLSTSELSETAMRSLLAGILTGAWTNKPEAWALPALTDSARPYESMLCLRRWSTVLATQLKPETSSSSKGDEGLDDPLKVALTLLAIRMERLRDLPPISRHGEAADHIGMLLTHKFGVQILRHQTSLNPRSPLTRGHLSKKGPTPQAEQSPDRDVLEISADPQELESYTPPRKVVTFNLPQKVVAPADSPTLKPPVPNSRIRSRRCAICFQKGHLRADCPLKNKPPQRRGKDTPGMPDVTLRRNGTGWVRATREKRE